MMPSDWEPGDGWRGRDERGGGRGPRATAVDLNTDMDSWRAQGAMR